jgi:hypothetical protein
MSAQRWGSVLIALAIVNLPTVQASAQSASVSTGLWLDVVQGKEVLTQLQELPGPRCSGINKSLEYKLKAGDARIQLSDNPGARVDVLVVRQR